MSPVINSEERVNILLVDDRPENLLALQAILEPLGQTLVRAHSGEDALKQVLNRDFAVILLDVQMPGISGFEVARIIKSRERSRHIPIIFLTAISKEESYVFEGYSVGAVDYIFKPFQPDILRSKVSVFVDLWLKQGQLKRQEALLRESQRRELELRHLAELRESEARLGEIVSSAMDAIIMFDEAGRITLFNAAAERMFRRRAREAIGNSIGEIFPERHRESYLERMFARGDGSAASCDDEFGARPQVEAFTAVRRGGPEFPLEGSISCMAAPAGKVYTMIARDVSERHEAEEVLRRHAVSLARTSAELQELNAELSRRQADLERAMSARSRFYASMSHELRTPINAILGYNTLLLEHIYGPLNEKQEEGLRRTHRAAKHLLELVNDVLDLSKIEAGKLDLSLQPVKFPALIEDLFVTVRPLADQHECVLEFSHRGDPLTVTSDPRRVRQILLNLLSNAIKFGRGRPIQVTCAPAADGGIEIAVTDHGEGIAPEDLPRIFDEFVQLSQPRQQEGTGLGLPISRRLALLLHGDLQATSTPGEGSTFRLTLPATAELRPSEARMREPRASEPAGSAAPAAEARETGPAKGTSNGAPGGTQNGVPNAGAATSSPDEEAADRQVARPVSDESRSAGDREGDREGDRKGDRKADGEHGGGEFPPATPVDLASVRPDGAPLRG